MNPEQVCAELLKMRPEADVIIRKYSLGNSNELAEDLLGDAILVVLESGEEFKDIQAARNYCFVVMSRIIEKRTVDAHRECKVSGLRIDPLLPNQDVPERSERTGKREYINSHIAEVAMNSLYWYDREILKLYTKLGSFRKVERETGIPYSSIYLTCKKATAQIAQFLNINE